MELLKPGKPLLKLGLHRTDQPVSWRPGGSSTNA